jgi:transposase
MARNVARQWVVGTELSDEQWLLIAHHFPEPKPNPQGGRSPVPPRPCLEGVIWILRTGAPWKDLPKHFPGSSTCWRRLRDWKAAGLWEDVWETLLLELDQDGAVEFSEGAGDGTFSPAKKGGAEWAALSGAKARRSCSSVKAAVCL